MYKTESEFYYIWIPFRFILKLTKKQLHEQILFSYEPINYQTPSIIDKEQHNFLKQLAAN